MSSFDAWFGVWLGEHRVGTLKQVGDRTWFSLDPDYRENPGRPVLGLIFEDRPTAVHSAAVRLPPWFSNLLPEGRLRAWIADERGVNEKREMEILAQVGHDLPGAVRVIPDDGDPGDAVAPAAEEVYPLDDSGATYEPGLRFSLAGVAIKFSMVRIQDKLTLPAHGMGGDWIVKLPDARFRDVPRNEFAMMSLARAVGIEVPEILLVPRSQVDERLSPSVWPAGEDYAYAIRRFDRAGGRKLIHIEDVAQVRNVYPDQKYLGNFETVASLIYRRRDVGSLQEFVRRLAFSILISNGDAHLKNWSLIYRDPRIPVLAPAYDLVSTGSYDLADRPEDLGLKFGGTRAFHRISLGTFQRLEQRLGVAGGALADCVALVVERTLREWPSHAHLLEGNQGLQDFIDRSIRARSRTLLRGSSGLGGSPVAEGIGGNHG
ncbi:type II toxin-antitoxin system HipA family toxin [Micromonospora sp. DT62]|uniref:type II toxin-antitoxin system HipA family toxin n=1 Tax=Micromonospora sp. DT62 TaxID=3416521 RepID=UPI003CF33C69